MAQKLPCHVRIVEARDLKAADVQGTSDPLVVVSLKGLLKKKHRTATIANTVNPVWNEEFILEPHHPEKDSIVIKVYDKDVVKNDLLGMLRLPLFNYFNRGVIDEWRPLTTKTGQPARGDIRIQINWGTAPIAHALPGSLSMMENRQAYAESAALGSQTTLLPTSNANPLDRNGDGRVDMRDLTQPNSGMVYSQNSTGSYPASSTTTTVQSNNALDRNGDGRVDARDFQQGGLVGQRTANPLDRNHDGKVDLKDLTGQPGYNQQGLVGQPGYNQQGLVGQPGLMGQRTANPLDRNHDGKVDLKDLTGQPGYNQQGLAGQPGLMGQRTANPLDRNHDGRVDAHDLTGRQSTTTTTTSTTFTAQPHGTLNPLDRNHDGKVDLQDLSGRQQVVGQPTPAYRY